MSIFSRGSRSSPRSDLSSLAPSFLPPAEEEPSLNSLFRRQSVIDGELRAFRYAINVLTKVLRGKEREKEDIDEIVMVAKLKTRKGS